MICVKLTNGFGNNLFQYNAARLLADFHNTKVIAIPPSSDYYGIKCLESIGVSFGGTENNQKNIHVNGNEHYVKCFNKSYSGYNIILSGYFEDYRFFVPARKKIKKWYPRVINRNDKDLVIHLRTGDRLFMKNEFYSKPKADDYINALKNFDFENLHIVTDMPVWRHIEPEELMNIKFHVNVPPSERVPIADSVDYFNSLVDAFDKYSPIVGKRNVGEDFNFIRSFNNILFEHGTLSWWAAFLSDADKVGVYGPWRPWKGATNKNLSNVPLSNWFKWGV